MSSSLRHWPAALIVILALLLLLVGQQLARDEEASFANQAEARLIAIATLKAQQFAEWRHERLADAQTLSDNPLLAEQIGHFLKRPGDKGKNFTALQQHLQSLRDNYRYDDILILDRAGTIRFSLNQHQGSLQPALSSLLSASLISGRAEMSDFHPAPYGGDFHISSVAPLNGASSENPAAADAAFVVLQSSLENALLPLLQSPQPLGSGTQSYLLKKEGEKLSLLGQPNLSSLGPLQYKSSIQDSGLQELVSAQRPRVGRVTHTPFARRPALAAIAPPGGTEWRIISLDEASAQAPASKVMHFAWGAAAALLLAALLHLLQRKAGTTEPVQLSKLLDTTSPSILPPSPSATDGQHRSPVPARIKAPSAPEPSPTPSTLSSPPPREVSAAPAISTPLEYDSLERLAGTPGFDIGAGLRVVAGRKTRYLELLGKYLKHHRSLAHQIAAAILANDQPLAQKLSHTLKGAAGTLGLQASQRAAQVLEQALRDGHAEQLPSRLAELTRVHDEQCSLLEKLLGAHASSAATASAPVAASLSDAELAELRRLLADDDIRSSEQAHRLRAPLATLLADNYDSFCQAIDRFDYPAALALLPAAKHRHDGNTGRVDE